MDENKKTIQNIDEYISQFSPEISERLRAIREVIHQGAPDAKEKISWAMPTFELYGNMIHFAAFKNHIGIYPGASGVEVFKDKLIDYKTSKGAIQLPNNKPIPFELIKEIVQYRVKENMTIVENKGEKQ